MVENESPQEQPLIQYAFREFPPIAQAAVSTSRIGKDNFVLSELSIFKYE
jgi:hypothetical protein